ncbi:hypothetical protein ACJJTC_006930 [Scirpophaga incertulas]
MSDIEQLRAELEQLRTQNNNLTQQQAELQQMVRRFSTSDSQRIRQLISGEELGDRKPSQFLRHLRSLPGNLSDDHILRELFMQRLPRSAQQILAAHADMKLEKVAELADSILEVNSSSVNSIQSSPQIAELTAQVLELTRQNCARSLYCSKPSFKGSN